MTTGAPHPDRPVLAGERTALAWTRSALALLAGAALALHHGIEFGATLPAFALAGLLVVAAGAAAAYGRASRRRLYADADWTRDMRAHPRPLRALSLLTAGVGALAAVLVLLA